MKYLWVLLLIPVIVYAGGVSGTVLDPDGNPVKDVVIRLMPGNFNGFTDENGSFSIYPIKPGPKIITVTLYGYEQFTEVVNVNDYKLTEINVYLKTVPGLPKPGSLAGRVTAEGTGAPVAQVRVEVAGTNRASTTDVDGNYHIDYIPPGEYEVNYDKYTYFTGTADDTVLIESSKTAVLDFEINPYKSEKMW